MTNTITHPVTIDLDEFYLDTDGEYDRETGTLLSIRIHGRDVDPEPLRVMLAGLLRRELDALDGETLDRLLEEEAENIAAEKADYMRDERMMETGQ